MAPRTWKRPLTLIYDNNYKYGTNLYSGAIGDIEKKYLASMSRTHLPVDRPDVALSTFAGSALTTAQRELNSSTLASTTTTTAHDVSSYDLSSSSSYELRKAKSMAEFDVYRSMASASNNTYLGTVAAAQEAEERRSRRRRRRRADDMDRLELHNITHSPVFTSYNYNDKMDVGFWNDKCRHLQSELDSLLQRVADTESIVKSDTVSAKSKIQQGIAELAHEIEDTARQSGELQKVIKRQAKHLGELQSLYDEVHHHLADANDEIANNSNRCHNLKRELETIRHSIDQAASRSSSRVHA